MESPIDLPDTTSHHRGDSLIVVDNPLDLLVPERFDLAAKLAYVRWYCSGGASTWPKNLYLDYIRKCDDLCDAGINRKTTEAEMLSRFNELVDSISARDVAPDMSTVKLGKDLTIIDGSHLTAACIYFKRPVVCRLTNNTLTESARSFKYCEKMGVPRQYLDGMAIEYARHKPNTFLAVIWPAGQTHVEEITDFILQHTRLVYQKDIVVNQRGHINILRECYARANRKGIIDKSDGTWTSARKGKIRALLLEAESLSAVVEAKTKARFIADIEKHSIHVTDTHAQVNQLASVLFSDHCLSVYNQLPFDKPARFAACFDAYRKTLEQQANTLHYCLGGNSTLAAFGLKDCAELEYFSCGKEGALPPKFLVHHANDSWYPRPIDEIVENPSLHFSYCGFKFVSLEATAQMLQKRNEIGDAADVAAIGSFLRRQRVFLKVNAHYQGTALYRFLRHFRLHTWRSMKQTVKRVLRALGVKKFDR